MPVATIEVRAAITPPLAVEQFLQQDTTPLMHGRADRHFTGLQVQVSQPPAILEHVPNQAVYFFFCFSAKCLRSFFFNCSNSFSSSMVRAGRN
jgi:hypothetical protein